MNIQTGEIFDYERSYYFWVSDDFSNFLDIQLKITKARVTIDDGFIFSNIVTRDIISEISIITS